MCLQTTWKKPKKALRDKVVYKAFDCGYRDGEFCIESPFNTMVWELNKIYTVKMKETDDFSGLDDLAERVRLKSKKKCISIGPGFHSTLRKDRLKLSRTRLYKCIIPKGSLYYTGFSGLVVSNKLKVIQEVKK